MKESFSGISLFQIVVLLILLFTAIMCLTINHSKAFAVKDEIINIIEREASNTINKDILEDIGTYLNDAGYRTTNLACPEANENEEKWQGYNRNGVPVSTNPSFCIRTINVNDQSKSDLQNECKSDKCTVASDDYPKMVYHEIVVFYSLDMPLMGGFLNFKTYGATKVMTE